MERQVYYELYGPEWTCTSSTSSEGPDHDSQNVCRVPAAYLIDKAGRVVWSRIDIEYRERPPNDQTRTTLDALK
jgi:hypothetical protein